MNTDKSILPVQDLSIAIENIFIQITEMGLGSFWKNVLPSETDNIRLAFNIPDNYRILSVLPIGYPARETKDHSDTEFDATKIHWNKW
jgi:Nitroreductase